MIAALFLASALSLAGVPNQSDRALTPGQVADHKRLADCIDKIDTDPEGAYEDAMGWANETHAPEARRCAALAMVGRGEPAVGAKRLLQLVREKDAGDGATRAEILVEAGNAWILAEQPTNAIAALDAALKLAPGSPDVLIDRARALVMLARWRDAETDLTRALDQRPRDAYALTIRAQTRLQQNVYDLALKDVAAALAIEPKNPAALAIRGAAIDAQSKAAPPR
jgi:tetratricopeptide (TPR) repeat protein